jgi:hypothetical protein
LLFLLFLSLSLSLSLSRAISLLSFFSLLFFDPFVCWFFFTVGVCDQVSTSSSTTHHLSLGLWDSPLSSLFGAGCPGLPGDPLGLFVLFVIMIMIVIVPMVWSASTHP